MLVINFSANGQDHDHSDWLPLHERRCATMKVDSTKRQNDGGLRQFDERDHYDKWISDIIAEKKRSGRMDYTQGSVYTIPIVFHIVHNGEAVGTGRNIPYSMVVDQVAVLNEDFRKMVGTAGFNANPVGADTRIEFCLAQRRPDGSAFPGGENGVNRINRTTAGFTAPPHTTGYIDGNIKPWTSAVAGSATRGYSPSNYFNMWICDISGGVLGYAQFPQSTLTGMPCTPQMVATDGVVQGYRWTGDINKTSTAQLVSGAPYNEGRTATHEVGHWLGLRHIWGDEAACNGDDFCADTPMAGNSNFGCPVGANSCPTFPGNDQIENYMDYTDDGCMNIFTIDQGARMRACLENSPLRKSLLQSVACIPPFANDASIIEVLAPVGVICGTSITPQVTIKNYGTATLTSATINYQVDSGPILTFAWTGSLAVGATANQVLPIITNIIEGTHTFRAFSTLPNGVADPNTTMDQSQNTFYIGGFYLPFTETFTNETFPPPFWTLVNGGQCPTWGTMNVTQISGTTGQSAGEYNFTYNPGTGDVDELYTPVITLPAGTTTATLQFDVSHRPYDATTNERLRVQISTDCGATYPTTIYDKTSNGATPLATGTALATLYYPTAAANWRTETVDLTAFAPTCASGTDRNIRLRFMLTNAFGNNVYIDNVRVTGTNLPEIVITEAGVNVGDGTTLDFGATLVGTPVVKTLTIRNTGNAALNLSGLTLTGSGYTTGALPASIAAGASNTFTVTFNPTCGATPTFAGTLSFTTNDCSENPYNFNLTGTANTTPSAPTVTGTTTLCGGGTTTLTASSVATSPVFQWYDAASGGTLLASTAAFTTPVLVSNTTYYVQVSSGSCASGRTPVLVNVSANPSNNNFCNAAAAFVGYNSFYSNRCANAQASEPSTPTSCFRTNGSTNPGVSHSVWFRFTSPVTQTYGACIYFGTDAANTPTGGQFDSEMAMYTLTSGNCATNPNFTGATPITLAQVVCNDDGALMPAIHGPWGVRSAFNCGSITAGSTVYFQVDGAWRIAGGTKGARMDAFPGASESDDFVLHIFPITLLDVDWVKFSAKRNDSGNFLEWITANESKTSHYEIERSFRNTANSFEKIGTVAAKGTTNTAYTFLDANAALTAYYRIKEVNRDGSSTFSKTIVVAANANFGILSLSPNPNQGIAELTFSVEAAEQVVLDVFDVTGRLALSMNLTPTIGTNTAQIDATKLSSGTYNLVLRQGSQRATARMVKQ